jgi:hypothetical protein
MTLLFLLLFCHALCSSDEPRLWASVPLEALHHHAREAGRSGDEELALDYLGAVEARLLVGERMDAADAVGALALLGQLRLQAGDQQGAEAAFRLMAGRFPGRSPCPRCPPTRVRHAPAPLECPQRPRPPAPTEGSGGRSVR